MKKSNYTEEQIIGIQNLRRSAARDIRQISRGALLSITPIPPNHFNKVIPIRRKLTSTDTRNFRKRHQCRRPLRNHLGECRIVKHHVRRYALRDGEFAPTGAQRLP